MSNPTNGTGHDPVPQSTVTAEIAKWNSKYTVNRQKNSGGTEVVPIQSFLIPKTDLANILGEQNVEHVRIYLAAGPYSDQDNHSISEVIKIYVVATDANYNDINLNGIYDFAHPCPPICKPNNSPLPPLDKANS